MDRGPVETVMRLNILSRSVGRARVLGAGKVLKNTLKGIAALGVDVRLNEPVKNHRYNWIHDAPEGVIEAGFAGRPVLVGPNTAAIPSDLPKFRPPLHPDSIYLFPSEWPLRAWQATGFCECQCRTWAAGIDIESFRTATRPRDGRRALIYFKHRTVELLDKVERMLRATDWDFEVLRYGSYSESEYQAALARARCAIWVGGTESQGFALMEALASGLPILVLGASSLADNVHDPHDPLVPRFSIPFLESGATTAPYFDSRCGWLIDESKLTGQLLDNFLREIDRFDPTAYVADGFTLEQSARRLVNLAQELPDIIPQQTGFGATGAMALRYLDLATRSWPWKLVGRRLMQRIR